MKYTPLVTLFAILTGCAATTAQPNSPQKPATPASPAAPKPPAGGGGGSTRSIAETKDLQFAAREAAENARLAAMDAERSAWNTKFAFASSITGPRGRKPLIIFGDRPESEALTQIADDMKIMGRILEKAASFEDSKGRNMGLLFRFSSSPPSRDMYIDGQGALFFVTSGVALVPSTAETDEEPAQKPPTEWEETKSELNEPERQYLPVLPPMSGETVEFSKEKLEDLEARVTMALTNAAHIRALKGNEMVTVVVSGPGAAPKRRHADNGQNKPSRGSRVSNPPEAPEPHLIVRAKVQDIQAFNSGNEKPDDFREKVSLSIY